MKTWFITGASRGLGLEIARAALAKGDQVVASGRDPSRIASALGNSDHALAVALDVTDDQSIEAAIGAAVARFGRIDVLVNNAGYGLLGAFEELSAGSIEKEFATNVFGAFAVTRAVLPIMRAQRAGHVISIASLCGLTGLDMVSVYCSTKFALAGWSESLSLELARFGIHATVVYPGMFRTDFLDGSSVVHADLSIEDYKEAAVVAKQTRDAANHQQMGDPVAFGRAMVEIANAEKPPVHFAVGSDGLKTMMEKAMTLQSAADAWRDLSVSTDI